MTRRKGRRREVDHILRVGLGRSELSKASYHRHVDARKLYENSRLRGAMYMGGYAVECKLKSKLMIQRNVWNLDDLKSLLGQHFYIHDLHELCSWLHGWDRIQGNRTIKQAWDKVKVWKVSWRYEQELPQSEKERVEEFLRCVERVSQWVENSL